MTQAKRSEAIVAVARMLARHEGFDYDRPDLGGMASEHHLYVMYEERAREVIAALSALQAPTQAKRSGPSQVLFGFASYADGRFELIVRDEKSGFETMLCGQLKPGQLAEVDHVLPTCVFVPAIAIKSAERSET